MTIQFTEPAKADYGEIDNAPTRALLDYLGNSTECKKLNVYDAGHEHVGYYSKRKAIQPAAINEAVARGYRVAACTRREIDGESVGYVEFHQR